MKAYSKQQCQRTCSATDRRSKASACDVLRNGMNFKLRFHWRPVAREAFSSSTTSLLFSTIIMEDLKSPFWKRALLVAKTELPVKVIKFINDLIVESNVASPCTSSVERPDSDVSQQRAKMEFLTVELFHAELQLDVLWQAMALAKNNFQRIGEDRDGIFAVMNQRPIPPQLPTEIIMQIAGYLRWDGEDSGRDSYSSLRRMACAFSSVDGMKDALLRKIPLVLFHSMANTDDERHEWNRTLLFLTANQHETIKEHPRFCRYDDEDAISRIAPDEEVHLVLPSESYAPKVSTRVFQMLSGRLHLSLLSGMGSELRDFIHTFLNRKLLHRVSSVTIRRNYMGPEVNWSVGTHEDHRFIDISVSERASFMLKAFPDCLSLLQHLSSLEIAFPSSNDKIVFEKLMNVLLDTHSSLQSLRLVGDGYLRDPLHNSVEARPSITMPDLQELSLEWLDAVDVFNLLNTLDCVKLGSLAIRSLGVDDRLRSSEDTQEDLGTAIANKITSKFPNIFRLAYTSETRFDNHLITSEDILLRLLGKPCHESADGAHSSWLLPNLRVLEPAEYDVSEWLLSLVSARLLSPDVASLHTIHLSRIEHIKLSKRWTFPYSRLDSLRLLVPEVLSGEMPSRF